MKRLTHLLRQAQQPVTTTWQLAWVHTDRTGANTIIGNHLQDQWEPFAVHDNVIYFRRQQHRTPT